MIRTLLLALTLASPVAAQEFTALARVDAAASRVSQEGDALTVELRLSQTVPYSVSLVQKPPRLVVDFNEVDWRGVDRSELAAGVDPDALQFGPLRPGTSRLVVELAGPMTVSEAGMQVSVDDGSAIVRIALMPTTPARFAEETIAAPDIEWPSVDAVGIAPDGPPVVVIDPGHGGIDPGAERGGLVEADLMLTLAREVADALNRDGQVQAILTRQSDHFVPLAARNSIARAAGASLFISLHADALEEDQTRGASVYTLSEAGADTAATRMAERHERGDLVAGLDLTETDDRVTDVLMDLARAETGPAGDRFADLLVTALRDNGARLNSRPRREGQLAVLASADFASVLLEAGFLSNPRDRALLSDADQRRPIVDAITQAVGRWVVEEATRRALVRQ